MTDFNSDSLDYPFAPAGPTLDNYHGRTVADPYRWLEDLEDSQTKDWLEKQADLTQYFFGKPQIKALRAVTYDRLEALWHYPKYSVLAREGNYYFFWGLDLTLQAQVQSQAVLYRLDTLESQPVALLDPNQLDPTGQTAITAQFFSPDGQLLAYAVSTGGSDWQALRIRHTRTLADYPEILTDCKATSVAWKPDNSGFFYNRFWSAQSDAPLEATGLFWHTLGTPQSADQLVFSQPHEANQLNLAPQITDDGRYIILHLSVGTEPSNRVYYRPVESNTPFIRLLDDNTARYSFLGNLGPVFYFQTDQHAPHGKIIAINTLFAHKENWQTVVAEDEAILDFGIIAGERLILVYLAQVQHTIKLYNLAGTFERTLPLPLAGSVTGLTGRADHFEIFLTIENFTCPPTVYRYNFAGGNLDPVIQPALDFDPTRYETRQVFYPAQDGTPVPMFVTHKKGLLLNGNQPTLLYGYGGFGKSLTPTFWLSQQVWLEQGGVLAVANIRGGGEYGQTWHEAARLGHRQTAIDDFCQAARWLTRHNYTRPARLAAMGASNGGLLVAACAVQQPTLFGAIICQAPLIDMLRYQQFGPGRAWVAEYGDAERSREEFEWLYAYSPLHNIKAAIYPATLITVPLADERVHPMHGLKFAAALQARHRGTKPILLRLETTNGHGMGKPATGVIEELADIYTFLFQAFEVKPFEVA